MQEPLQLDGRPSGTGPGSGPISGSGPGSGPGRAARQLANRRRLADDYRDGRVSLRGRPTHLKIELTNFCNLACPMCPHSQMRRPVGYMAPELFRSIVDQAGPELEFAYLHHLGESLFHPRIGELVAYGKRRGVALGLSTNATFLTARKTQALLGSGLDFLVISLDANSEQSYAHMRRGGDFARTVDNVRRFFAEKAARKSPIRVVVQMIVSAHNQHEAAAFARAWDGQVVLKVARDWAGQVPLTALLRPAASSPALVAATTASPAPATSAAASPALATASPALATSAASDPALATSDPAAGALASAPPGSAAPLAAPGLPRDPDLPQAPCRMLWTELTVFWDGRVVPCANVYEPDNLLGDLRTQTLDEVWNGPPIQALRRAHLEDRVAAIPVCRSCPRHPLDRQDFIAVDQLTQRLRNYVGVDLTPRKGLS